MIGGVFSISGDPGKTVKLTAGNGAESLPSNVLVAEDGRPAKAVLITCETNDLRFCLGGIDPMINPTLGHILAAASSVRLSHPEAVRKFRYVNKTASSNAILMVTAEY